MQVHMWDDQKHGKAMEHYGKEWGNQSKKSVLQNFSPLNIYEHTV